MTADRFAAKQPDAPLCVQQDGDDCDSSETAAFRALRHFPVGGRKAVFMELRVLSEASIASKYTRMPDTGSRLQMLRKMSWCTLFVLFRSTTELWRV